MKLSEDLSDFNPNEFIENCNAHTLEALEPYEEQYVAWSLDGKQILAHAATEEQLYEEIKRLGLARYVVDFIPNPDIGFLGGGSSFDLQDPEISD
jgi:hypothetical protein